MNTPPPDRDKPAERQPGASSDDNAAEARSPRDDKPAPERDAPAGEAQAQGDELNQMLGDLLAKKKRRKYQLNIIKDFFEEPEKYGVDADDVPHSSTREEMLARHSELTYRIALLKSVLRVLERKRAELGSPDDTSGNDSSG